MPPSTTPNQIETSDTSGASAAAPVAQHAAETIRDAVRERYGAIAASVAAAAAVPESRAGRPSCCTPGAGAAADALAAAAVNGDPIARDLYAVDEVADLPPAAVLASLGCGNPTALAELRPGEVVLDLGSGGGIDVLLSARRVGPGGFAYGVDMTDEMLALAERNAAEAGVANVCFLKGQIEAIPLPAHGVDVVISNCVVNLSPNKAQVLREAFRVLKPGGRFAVSDVVVQGHLPAGIRRNMELWAGCVAGALEEATYRRLLADAGFQDIEVEVTRVYAAEDLCSEGCGAGGGAAQAAALSAFDASGGRLVSAFVRATKPSTSGERLPS